MPNSRRVFISHIHEESALGGAVKAVIEDVFRGHGVTAFLSSDQDDLPAGRKWMDVISAALDEAQVVVSLLSPHALGRPWVNIELGAGWIKGRHIIPLCHSGLALSSLPRPFGDFNGVSLDQDGAADRLLSGVADGLRLERPRRLAFAEILNELRAAAGRSPRPAAAPVTTAANPDLPPEQVRILQTLARAHDRGIEDVQLRQLADEAGIKPSAFTYHLDSLVELDYVYVGYYTRGEPDARLRPAGAEWLLKTNQMP